MRPVLQTVTEPGKGNCLAACFASLLECAIEEIPDLACGANLRGLNDFLAGRGLAAAWIQGLDRTHTWCSPLDYHVILIGPSPRRKVLHAVVAKPAGYGFEVVHDPHPEGGGLAGPPCTIVLLTPLRPEAR